MVIFSYTGSSQVKISQKVLGGGATFFDSHCMLKRLKYHSVSLMGFSCLLNCISKSGLRHMD